MPDSTQSEKLTSQFYEWEQRGRGWLLADCPVQLEAPFYPFFYHYVPATYIDDGKRPTLVSKAIDFLKGRKETVVIEQYESEEIEPFEDVDNEALVVLSISFPKHYKVRHESMEQLLIMLSNCIHPISFEIIATNVSITIQFTCRDTDAGFIQSQVKAYFPDCTISRTADRIAEIILEEKAMYTVDFGLQEEFMRPLSIATNFDHDPFIGLFGIFENLEAGSAVIMQVLFSGTVNSWTESMIQAVSDGDKGSFFLDAPEMPELTKVKVSRPLYAVTIRVLTQGETLEKAYALLVSASVALITLSTSKSNALTHLTDESYNVETRIVDIFLRRSHRLGMLLNSQELATLVHFPSLSIISDKLKRDTQKTKASPFITEGHQYLLGLNVHQEKKKVVSLSTEQRFRHIHIIGATGTGKSTLLLNLISQDIKNGNGIAVLDPHGDLIESILSLIPENRIEDVIVIDPFDSEYPVGFNILTAHSEIEKEILSSDLVTLFRRFSTSWGDQMNSVFANAILAILESSQGGTLVDLRRFLIEKEFRDQFLTTVTDPEIVYYWQKEYPLLKSTSIGPILTRLDTFLRPKLIRNMVNQKESLDFEAIMNTKKIVLVKLSQGLIGAENSFLLGALIVSKFQQAAMARQIMRKDERNDFFLYIDEFHHFITASMSTILSGARKYHLGLVLAHQDMEQVVKSDSELASGLIANAGTRICYRLGDSDAKKFQEGFSSFSVEDLQNLSIGTAIARVNQTDLDFSLQIAPLSTIQSSNFQDQIVQRSREKYAKKILPVGTTVSSQPDQIDSQVSQQPIEKQKPEPENIESEMTKKISKSKKRSLGEIAKDSEEIEEKKKEQSKHRYLQILIKKMAEERGYKASLEVPTKDGKGKVDVVLEKEGKSIACEISVTTNAAWELHNIKKCLEDGYDMVVACSTLQKTISAIQKEIDQALSSDEKERVLVFEPEAFFDFLDKQQQHDVQKTTTIKGYRVKVDYGSLSSQESIKKKESISGIIAKSLKSK